MRGSAGRRRGDGRQTAHAQHARIGRGKRTAGEKGHRVLDLVRCHAAQELRHQPPLLEPPAIRLEPAAQGRRSPRRASPRPLCEPLAHPVFPWLVGPQRPRACRAQPAIRTITLPHAARPPRATVARPTSQTKVPTLQMSSSSASKKGTPWATHGRAAGAAAMRERGGSARIARRIAEETGIAVRDVSCCDLSFRGGGPTDGRLEPPEDSDHLAEDRDARGPGDRRRWASSPHSRA